MNNSTLNHPSCWVLGALVPRWSPGFFFSGFTLKKGKASCRLGLVWVGFGVLVNFIHRASRYYYLLFNYLSYYL